MQRFIETDRLITVDNLDSSAIKSFQYDKATEILTITFTSGGQYDYPNVPIDIVREWLEADSKGKFYNKEIRYVYAC